MTIKRVDFRANAQPGTEALVRPAIELWMDVLDADPILMLTRHRPTGGLMVVPIFDENATTEHLLVILEGAVAYIRKSQSS